ncbi:MAG: hypothetical protein JOZ41_05225 [Chloroflexi bacterium]|nr:hypothetical protein [Chloroflexota bacterium]
MLRFKHFSGSGPELEKAVNAWLNQFEPDVKQMTQTPGPDGAVLLSFLFEESFRGQELRLSYEHEIARAVPPSSPGQLLPDEPIHVQEPGGPTSAG